MKYEITIEEDGFVVRANGKFAASFIFFSDAELFATMMGCSTCKEDVYLHSRRAKHEQEKEAKYKEWQKERELDHPSF